MNDSELRPDTIPAPLPPADAMTMSGFTTALDRVVSLICLASLVPVLVVAKDLPTGLSRPWLMVFGGGFAAAAALMPLYAWSRRGIKPLATLYSAAVGLAAITWPLSGRIGDVPAPIMITAFLLGLGAICASLVLNTRAGLIYALLGSVLMVITRLSPAGGQGPLPTALLDGAVMLSESVALLLLVQYLRDAAAALDAQQAARYHETAEAAVNQALFDERRRLDAIVHDEVMTTLVAAAGDPSGRDPHVGELARAALATLADQNAVPEATAEVSTDQLARLVKDVAASVCPRAEVLAELPSPPVALPAGVARVLLQATREAALNAEKHSGAAQIQVLLSAETRGRRAMVRVSVADDGKGFDPEKVPAERLGLRVALQGRMETIGGRAEIVSRPNRGTSVRLNWSGEPAREVTARRTSLSITKHPLFGFPPPARVNYALLSVLLVHAIEGIYVAPALAQPPLIVPALALGIVGLAVCGYSLLNALPGAWWGWVTTACILGMATLAVFAMPAQEWWPPHASWFATLVAAGAVMLFAGGRTSLAWVVAVGHALVVLLAGRGQDTGFGLLIAFVPTFWLGVEAITFTWLDNLWGRLDEIERSVAEGARVNAAMFSRAVLQEVWLSELRSEVGPTLTKIAAGTGPVTDDDRADYLLIESGLRDGIKATNFASPRLSASIKDARRRGVEVTLVDNRGGRLPDRARRSALRSLEDIIGSASAGKVVARTAPAGYSEAITIVHVTEAGEAQLTRIAEDGSVSSRS